MLGGTFSASAAVNVVSFLSLVLGQDVISELLILEGAYDLKDVLISHQPVENVLELFGTGARPTEERAALSDCNECRLEFLQNAFEVVD